MHVGEKSSFFRKEAREPFLCLVKRTIVAKEELSLLHFKVLCY